MYHVFLGQRLRLLLLPPKAHKFIQITESTQASKGPKKTKGPGERAMQNKAPRGRSRSVGECRGVSGIRGAAPELFWAHRGEIRVMENLGSGRNCDK